MSATLYFYNPATKETVKTENELNFSNSNAAAICNALKMDSNFDEAPPIAIEDFQLKCDSFLKGETKHFIEKGFESHKEGNWIDCGRREGYLQEKIELALSACLYARLMGAREVYFA